MTKALKWFVLCACFLALSVCCYLWARAVAGESSADSFAPIFPGALCALGVLAGVFCATQLFDEVDRG